MNTRLGDFRSLFLFVLSSFLGGNKLFGESKFGIESTKVISSHSFQLSYSSIMSLQKLTAEIYSLFGKGDYQGCQQLLAPIKLELVKHDLLVPLPSNTTDKTKLMI